MVFSSPIFLFFFLPCAYIVYRVLPGLRLRNIWLALSSLVFFSFGQLVYVPLLLCSVLANFLFGLWLQGSRGRRAAVALAAVFDLGLLGTFKYLDFFLSSLGALTGLEIPLTGLELPIGISFFTFQGLSYVIDVYRDPTSGSRSFWKILLYISFFPQLIAGPIVIYHDVAGQIDRRALTPELTLSGLRRFIGGLGKKLLLADTAGKVADAVFAMTAAQLDARLAWLGAVCYTLQIYFDFSGYSDMAIGLGRIFGFRFLENFSLPYVSKSTKEFWRRWHISLSTWFRDYLYIPLGGNRRGRRRTALNKTIVFFTTGLWHGANWTFVLWGLWHGLFATLEDVGAIPKRLRQSPLGHVYEMLVVILGFTLFRADDLGAAWVMVSQMFAGWAFSPARTLALRGLLNFRAAVLLAVGAVLAVGLPQRLLGMAGEKLPQKAVGAAAGAFYTVLFALCVLNLVSSTFSPFIYFQF